MKFIVNESQFDFIKEYSILQEITGETLTEGFDIKSLINRYKAALAAGIAASVIAFAIDGLGLNEKYKNYIKQEVGVEQQVNTLRDKKIEDVTKYIAQALKNQNMSIENLQLSPEKIVDVCQKNNFDLPLLLAQAHLESCFGMTNRARKTNSVWSVGSYDSGKNACTYPTQDDSIQPYINLMKAKYLNDKSIDELLSPGGFVNDLGMRYASDKNYENKVKSIRNKIIRLYPDLA